MICLVQRVTQAKVEINQKKVAQIGPGLVILTAFKPQDSAQTLQKMVQKLLHYRLFADKTGKMNLNVQQTNGQLLIVPQFTLAANTKSGLRPSFSTSAPPAQASLWFKQFVAQITQHYRCPQTGQFGADMQVSLTNDGPVTFWLEID